MNFYTTSNVSTNAEFLFLIHLQTIISIVILIICGSILLIALFQLGKEKQRQNVKKFFQDMFDQAFLGMGLIDIKGQILTANVSFALMLGYTAFENMPSRDLQFYTEKANSKNDTQDCTDLLSKFENAWKKGFLSFERTLHKKNLELIETEIVLNRVLVRNQVMLMFTIGDISERKKINLLKDEFVSMVSHELRTPLTAIKGTIDLLFDGVVGDLNQEQKNMLIAGKRNIERLTRLINEVLDLQKLRRGKLEMHWTSEDIKSVIEEAVQNIEAQVREKKLNLCMEFDENLPEIIVMDRDRIIQVLINLLNNAIKFSNKGSIIISVKSWNTNLQVSISDEGIGISKDDIPKLFHHFVQLAPSQYRKVGSTGLGLVICKQLIENHQGRIWINSVLGKGSVFTFEIPLEQTLSS
jgi:PAS domain S-box-containing protein